MPSSTRGTRQVVEALARVGPLDQEAARRLRGAARIYLGLLIAALAERVGLVESCGDVRTSLHVVESLTGYRFLPSRRCIPEGAWRSAIDNAYGVSAEGFSPHATLTRIYEDMLQVIATVSSRGISLGTCKEHRKEIGAFYTPPAVVRRVVRWSTAPMAHLSEPRILDLAMGTGTFLIEALEAHAPGDEAGFAERALYGIDLDPMAVRLAILSLWLRTGARPRVLATHLRYGDALTTTLPPRSFDIVLGNPPWGARYGRDAKAKLRARYPTASRLSFDSFKLFLDLGSSVSRGTLGMVVPHAVLTQSTHADVRYMLLDRLAPYAGVNLGDGLFPGAAAPACALVFGQRPPPPAIQVGDDCTIPAAHWTARGFPLTSDRLLELLQRLRERHPAMADVSDLYRIRDVGVNYNRASVARRILYTGPRRQSGDVPRYRGRNFDRYTAITAAGWIRHQPDRLLEAGEALSMNWMIYNLPEKIVLRQTADRIVATLDWSRMVMGRSVLTVTREGDVSLPALLALLNSRLVTSLYRAMTGEEGRVLPQVKVAKLLMLPVPTVCSSSVGMHERQQAEAVLASDRVSLEHPDLTWACLDVLAGRLLRCGGRDEGVLAQVDSIVRRLYGVSEEEMAYVAEAEPSGAARPSC